MKPLHIPELNNYYSESGLNFEPLFTSYYAVATLFCDMKLDTIYTDIKHILHSNTHVYTVYYNNCVNAIYNWIKGRVDGVGVGMEVYKQLHTVSYQNVDLFIHEPMELEVEKEIVASEVLPTAAMDMGIQYANNSNRSVNTIQDLYNNIDNALQFVKTQCSL